MSQAQLIYSSSMEIKLCVTNAKRLPRRWMAGIARSRCFVQREGGKGFAVVSVDPNMRVATLKELALAKLLLHRTLPLDETTLRREGATSSLDDTCVIRYVIMAGMKLIIHAEGFAGKLPVELESSSIYVLLHLLCIGSGDPANATTSGWYHRQLGDFAIQFLFRAIRVITLRILSTQTSPRDSTRRRSHSRSLRWPTKPCSRSKPMTMSCFLASLKAVCIV